MRALPAQADFGWCTDPWLGRSVVFATQRQEKIREVLLHDKIVDVSTLTELLNVSDVTVRKDLDKLAEEGFLAKIHGGAVLVENEAGRNQDIVNIPDYAAKKAIAKTAMSIVEARDAIFVGPGSTCYLMHSFFKNMPEITVVTNNVSLALEIHGYVKKVFLLGGEVRHLRGLHHNQPHDPEASLSGFFVNKAFFSAEGFDLQAGVAYSEILDYNLIKVIVRLCKSTYLMVDNGKFNKVDLYSIGDISLINCVITDNCEDKRYQKYLFENNTKFVFAYQKIPE